MDRCTFISLLGGYSPEFAVLGRSTTTDDVAAADDVVAGTWLALGTS